MKKIILFSFIILASVVITSCTADNTADDALAVKQTNLVDIGGQNAQLPPPPPPK